MPRTGTLAPGARVVIRDAEWIIKRVDRSSTGGESLQVVGVSGIVRDKTARFLTAIDKDIKVLDPAETELVPDTSPQFRDTKLYLESLLRQSPPTDSKLYVGDLAAIDYLYIGHLAAIDDLPYQLDPAAQALDQPRQRILMADGTGLGKTIEVGVLLAELIRRGRGRRILAVTTKAMTAQFQKELWARFTIPLVRLDSEGIQRIRGLIPTNANPFDYYDKSIISVDTLKQDAEYRVYLEHSYWDIIVIDEAQNVAERGSLSMRAKVAKLLASRSDTLIMTSATPHDGKARSFASLMNMLNPTAIANPDDYGPDDIKGLFVRRFKKDIRDQVGASFKDRRMTKHAATASPAEEAAFERLTEMTLRSLDRTRRAGQHLFRTVLEKSLFSSPGACLQTIQERIRKLSAQDSREASHDVSELEGLAEAVAAISAAEFSKYQQLLTALRPRGELAWSAKDPRDRLVIFTERIETLKFLAAHLKTDLGLADDQVATLFGDGSDVELQKTVEAFGRDREPVRLLIASDVASEGLNLHFLCHRMVHFDIPWSLMVFQQRNGRIDRYGQDQEPQIGYFYTVPTHVKIRGDNRILELLIEKDHQAALNIGDPSAFMGVYDEREEELTTARAMEDCVAPETFEARLEQKAKEEDEWLKALWGTAPVPNGAAANRRRRMPSLYADDLAFARQAIDHIKEHHPLDTEYDAERRQITITLSPDMERMFKVLPPEVIPDDRRLHLTIDRGRVKTAIRATRAEDRRWPDVQLLWELHPIVEWLNLKLLVAFGRHQAPVIPLRGRLGPGQAWFLVQGQIPNLKAHPAVHSWFALRFRNGRQDGFMSIDALLDATAFATQAFPNSRRDVGAQALRSLLPEVVEASRGWMSHCRREFENAVNPRLNEQLTNLERLRKRQVGQLEMEFPEGETMKGARLEKKHARRRAIDELFDDYLRWVEDTMTTEDSPYIRIAAVFVGEE
jgi:superfamily II DNA or RNA helicase